MIRLLISVVWSVTIDHFDTVGDRKRDFTQERYK